MEWIWQQTQMIAKVMMKVAPRILVTFRTRLMLTKTMIISKDTVTRLMTTAAQTTARPP